MSDPFNTPPFDCGELTDAGARLGWEVNDRDNGRRLFAVLPDRLLYVPGLGWGCWDGKRFDFDAGEEMALQSAAHELPKAIIEEAAARSSQPVAKEAIESWLADNPGKDVNAATKVVKADGIKHRRAYATRCGNNAPAKAALDAARTLFRCDVDQLDSDPLRLTCANGVLDLKHLLESAPDAELAEERVNRLKAAFGPFDPVMRGTRRPAAAFNPEADCPGWRRFVGRAMPNSEDAAYLQRCLAACLPGRNERQIALMMLGQGGNGKSTAANALKKALGGYAATCRIEMFLEAKFTARGNATPDEAILPGARAYIAAEPETGAILSSSKIKGLTGGEPRQSRPLYGKPFTWIPHGVPVLSFNRMPRVTDESEGMWRRLVPIIFPVKLHELPLEDRVTPAEMEQIIEAEASGILNWILEGWVALNERGLDPPASALDRKAALQAMSDPVGEFLGAATVRSLGFRTRTSELHKAFTTWCEAEGFNPMSAKSFTSAMLARDFTKVQASNWFWEQLELRDRSLLDPEDR